MPELPEVETVRRGLVTLSGKKINQIFRSDKKMRIGSTLDLHGLEGAEVLDVTRRARYLIINFDNGQSLIVHLGMSGKITLGDDFKQLKHDHFACELNARQILKQVQDDDVVKTKSYCHPELVSGSLPSSQTNSSWLVFNDPRRFGFIDLIETKNLKTHKMLSKLGPEPLSNEFNFADLKSKLSGKKMNIKTAMMDNEIVVGVGNIYINESLFDSAISPLRDSSSLKDSELKKLISSIKKIIQKAIDLGGSSISDYVDAKGDLGNFQNNFKVYGRNEENCLLCKKNLIRKIKQNGRSSFYCEHCQK